MRFRKRSQIMGSKKKKKRKKTDKGCLSGAKLHEAHVRTHALITINDTGHTCGLYTCRTRGKFYTITLTTREVWFWRTLQKNRVESCSIGCGKMLHITNMIPNPPPKIGYLRKESFQKDSMIQFTILGICFLRISIPKNCISIDDTTDKN